MYFMILTNHFVAAAVHACAALTKDWTEGEMSHSVAKTERSWHSV